MAAKACRNNDLRCEKPVDTFTDLDGLSIVRLTLPNGFFGFFEVTGTALDALLYTGKPITQDVVNRDVPVLTAMTVDLIARTLRYTYDANKGLALLEALDHSGMPQGGIHFGSSDGGDPFYMVDQLPQRDANSSVYDQVNKSAIGGFINLTPGFFHFSASDGLQNLRLGSFNAQIRPRMSPI